MMSKLLVAVLSAVALAGCVNREAMTSGVIGCPVNEVHLKDVATQLTTGTWTATCRGKTFYCTAVTEANVVCSPELKGS